MDGCYIHIRKTKNGSERIVPLCESMKDVLNVYLAHRDRMPIKGVSASKSPLFIKTDGTEIKAGCVYNHMRKLLEICGIPYKGNHMGPRVHDLRHVSRDGREMLGNQCLRISQKQRGL